VQLLDCARQSSRVLNVEFQHDLHRLIIAGCESNGLPSTRIEERIRDELSAQLRPPGAFNRRLTLIHPANSFRLMTLVRQERRQDGTSGLLWPSWDGRQPSGSYEANRTLGRQALLASLAGAMVLADCDRLVRAQRIAAKPQWASANRRANTTLPPQPYMVVTRWRGSTSVRKHQR
jgi:hypothetical protein